jgi:uncharacterized protein YndB with AHSA1/START domain
MAKPSVTVERIIAAPADRFYELVSDLPRMGEWSPENTGGKWVKGSTGAHVGARFKGSNRQGWRRWSTDVTVLAAEPGRRFSFDVTAGPFKVANWTYELSSVDEGTRVAETWTDHRAAWMATLSGVLVGVRDRAEVNRANMELTLAALERCAVTG